MEYMIPQKTVTVRFLKARKGFAKDQVVEVTEQEAEVYVEQGLALRVRFEGPQAEQLRSAAMAQKPQQPQPQPPQQPGQPPQQPQPPDQDKDQPDQDKG